MICLLYIIWMDLWKASVFSVLSGWLRRQVGVVLQENELLNRSVRDNISLGNPMAPMESVIEAARLAGAHEFILQLPYGYDTQLEERGRNLSGGQRQRIAIARALIGKPSRCSTSKSTVAEVWSRRAIIHAFACMSWRNSALSGSADADSERVRGGCEPFGSSSLRGPR